MQSSVDGVGASPRLSGVWPQRSELRASLVESTADHDPSPSRRDKRKAAKVFELVGQPEEHPTPARSHARVVAALAGALGVVVGLLLALLLAHTAFAPDNDCRAGATGASGCAHAAR